MRILFLSQLNPYPPDAGPKVRSFNVLRYLASAGHQITLLYFSRPDDSAESLEVLGRICEAVHSVPIHRSRLNDMKDLVKSIFTPTPFLIARDSAENMHERLEALWAGGHFDAIHADQLWMAQFVIRLWERLDDSNKARSVLDQHNAVFLIPERLSSQESNPLRRQILRMEREKLLSYELEVCNRFDHVVWVSDDDRRALAAASGTSALKVAGTTIPICIDSESKDTLNVPADAHRVTFIGGLHWPPNREGIIWFARTIWPQIVAQAPEAIFTVIGKQPPIDELAGIPNVELTGYVDDPKQWLAKTAVFIVPLRSGGGMRVKILDAWSWGLPIISTSIGAEGLSYQSGVDLIIADDAASFARAVLQLLKDSGERRALAAAGRNTVLQHYEWRTIYRQWDEIYPRDEAIEPVDTEIVS